jgi:ATPase subunit of ABC transporter with duplicated ATPase domains
LILPIFEIKNTIANNYNSSHTSLTIEPDGISVKSLDLTYGSKKLLTAASFTITRKSKIGVVGVNGSGKTTLAKWIQDTCHRPKLKWVVYEVEQELAATDATLLDTVLSADIEKGQIYARVAELENKDELNDSELVEYERLCDDLSSRGSDADKSLASKILKGLGFANHSLSRKMSHLSGGWRARLSLARGLFMRPSLLILDEPTNHLDLKAIEWLIEFCETTPSALFIISHNKHFLSNVSNTIFDFETSASGGSHLQVYKSTVYRYQIKKKDRLEKLEDEWKKAEREIKKLTSKGKHDEAEKLRREYAAKGIVEPPKCYDPSFITSKHSITQAYKNGDAHSTISQRRVKLLGIDSSTQLGYDVDNPVLDIQDFAIYPYDRIVLIGKNGAGKSTLMKTLKGELNPLKGEIQSSRKLRVAMFNQHFFHDLPHDITPLEFIHDVTLSAGFELKKEQIHRLLGESGMASNEHYLNIGQLSGGQKTRVYLASIFATYPDILLLDEPTNHLDFETSDGLVKALKGFQGAVVCASHDMSFIEEIEPTSILLCELGEVYAIDSIDDYLRGE